ncbi:MAG: ABC transporter permease [Candidatus Dormibacteria bacterium]|jgi:ABC transporter DrrB family efflux protein
MSARVAVQTERQLLGGLLDAYTATRRFLIRGMRQPDVIFGSVLIPVIFVVLFGYVFGSSIRLPGGGNYRSYLMPGLFAMSVLFNSNNVAVAVATDMSEGVVDRFRTLPIARSAIVIGRSLSSLILGIPVLVVMIVCGLAVGWRPEDGLGNAVLALLLFELFGYAIGWLGVLVGLLAGGAQAADVIISIPTFLLGFISSVFVDPALMPPWLRVIAYWNPVSAVVTAGRQLFGNTIGPPPSGVWSLDHPIATTIALAAIIMIVVIPICVRRYSHSIR